MNNKFWSGFAGGLTGGVLIFAIIFAVYTSAVEEKFEGLENAAAGAQSTEASGLLADEEFQEKIEKLESLIDAYYIEEVSDEELKEGIYDGLLYSLEDPYSCYYTQEEYEELMISSSGVYCGIGATVQQSITTGIITIVKPFVDCPAYNAGLLQGDIVYKVDGVEVTGRDLTEVIGYMKGEEGTTVTIEVIRDGETDPISLVVERARVEVPTVEYRMLEDQIGYIYIMEFDEITEEQFREAIDDLEKQGMEGLIIDVRDNPGGLYSSVCNMLDRLLPEGLIVYTEDKYGRREEKRSTAEESFDKPMAVLINGSSASASEIFAGALQDYQLATIVGTQSYGKGIVQSLFPLYDDSAIKLTVSRYYTPNGVCIHGTGITPDIEIDLDNAAKKLVVIPEDQDTQLQKAIEAVKEKLK
ncbi:MAG: S41 family peptidase [Lachnospiraceae bacterium]|nr:S41 family peptidase [Lachnospiraceae bacterium]